MKSNSKPQVDSSKHKKQLTGVVVSDKMHKTIVVEVKSFHKHKKYGKFLSKSKKYKAHDENNAHKVGESVTIEECRPYSKDKNFIVVS